ncbi:MAG TPA: translation elongation factor Ts [Mycobacteriales bacterium]|nr:translation elongation factor Ts [Mycobacteriales bacterium]
MANFSTADVKRLRDLTGAGMMSCKKTLEDADGDFDRAVELLRIKGAKDVDKRAGRTAANGLVTAADGAMIELNCETDFVAKNEQFQQLGADIVALVAATRPADLDALLGASLADGRTVRETVESVSMIIGEKVELRRFVAFDGRIATYLHKRNPDLPPQVGVLVEYTGDGADTARGAAMQVAAMRPRYVRREEVPAEVVDAERRIAEETARAEGKPDGTVPRIVEGRVNAFFKDTVLLEQPSVQDGKQTVRQLLDDASVTVTRFARFEVGQV